jgi:hypothetical protein
MGGGAVGVGSAGAKMTYSAIYNMLIPCIVVDVYCYAT